MEQIGGGTGVFWIALALVLAGFAIAVGLHARRYGREPGPGMLFLLGAVVLTASSFVLGRMIFTLDPEPEAASEAGPIAMPEWILAGSTATIAGIVGVIAAAAWLVYALIRGRVQYQQGVEADEAILHERRNGSAHDGSRH